MGLTVHVTRDATITYSAKVELSEEDTRKRCGKYGFDATGLDIEWEETAKFAYDNVEHYEIEESGEVIWKEDLQ